MKIAVIASTFPPYHGGIGNIAYYNALDLYQRGHEAIVFTPKYKSEDKYNNFPFKVVRLTPWLKYGNSAFCPQLFWKLWQFKKIYLLYPFFGGAEVVWLLKIIKRQNIKLLLNYQMDVVISGWLGKIIAWHKKILLPLIIKSADRVSFSSFDYGQHSDVRKLVAKYPDKFLEIPNGVDVKKFKILPTEEVAEFKNKLGIAETEKTIMLCGGLDQAHYFKGVKVLLYAFQKLIAQGNHYKLIIVGDGDLKSHYEKLSGKLGVAEKVIFPGSVGHDELVKYYNACDVFTLPSLNKGEAFGIVLIEALICGKPVVASNLAGVRSVFKVGKQGLLVKPSDVDDLVDKLKSVLDNKEMRVKVAQTGEQWVQERYDWRKIGESIEEELSN